MVPISSSSSTTPVLGGASGAVRLGKFFVATMATAGADGESLYLTLGVDPTVSGEAVRKAYRKLVLTCHPDKVRDPALRPAAETLFHKIVTAYEVLSDDVNRREYDKRCKLNGAEIDDVLVNVTLKEALTGATKLAMVLALVKCGLCAGVGLRCESCVVCGGRRRNEDTNKECGACAGRGFGAPTNCDACKSFGIVEDFFQGRVSIPAGVADGARVRVTGKKQHARIRIMPSKLFQREGVTIKSTLTLTKTEAETGGFFDVETIGGTETVFLDAAVQTGETKTLGGKGLPLPGSGSKRGNHVVRIEVKRGEGDVATLEEQEDTTKATKEDEKDDETDEKDDAPRPAKRAKTASESAEKEIGEKKTEEAPREPEPPLDLAALLAAKKKALLAQLESKTGGA